jgi:O-antigen/teichoic acid export membrane protein
VEEQEHVEPTAEINLETVKKRSVSGVLTLTGRTLILNLISFLAQGLLWAFLSPSEFGVFWVVSAVVNFLAYFGDIGLAAALIQKKESPTRQDLTTTFTVQQTLVVTLLLILFVLTPVFGKIYGLTPQGYTLMYALGISFLLSSLKGIPSMLLERSLEFGKLVIPQVIETMIYSLSVVYFAWKGFGISSFTYSVLIRGVVGLVMIYFLKPWKPGISFSMESFKGLLKFGLPYQVNTFLAVLKDDGMTVILGGILGTAGMGILGTARKLAQYPLRFFMDNVTRVTFPAFSRMQGEKADLKKAVEKSIFFITFLVFPSIIGLCILFPTLITVIPRYDKWTPAIIPLAILSIDTIFAAVTTQLTNVLNAIGKIKVTFYLMLMWTGLAFLLVPFLSIKYGVIGSAVAFALVSTSSVVAIMIVKKHVEFSLISSAGKPLLAAILMGASLFAAGKFLPQNLYAFGLEVVLGVIVYGICVYLLMGDSLLEDVKKAFNSIFRNA